MRTRRTKEQIRKDIYNRDVDAYNFYVVNLDTMKAETGFEFKEDAVDVLNDYDDKKKYKVVSKESLKTLGIENPNESFKYETGGKIKPFMYKENNSTIIINGTKADVKKMYLDYVNNFLSVSRFAEYYNISERQANSIIESGRKYAKEDGYYANGGGLETDINFRNFTINELIKILPQDVEFMWIVKEKTPNFIRRSNNEFKKISNTKFTITDFGTLELSKGSENLYLDIKVMEVSDDAPEVSYFISLFTKDNHKGLKEFSKGLIEKFEMGGVTNNYVSRRNLNTITIKKGNQKLTYKISDVLNGAYKLESGAKLEDIAFYVPKRSIVKVQLKTGKDFKPANGYWIKDGAKPIHVNKFDDGGNIYNLSREEFMKKEIDGQKEKEKSITFKKYKVNVYEEGYPFVEPLMTDNFIEAINFAKKTIESQRGYRSTSKDLFAEISKFQPIEERGNVRYPYSSFASFSEEDLKTSKFNEGGVMSRLLTRKKDQPKVETTDEDIDLKEDSRIRVRPSSFVRKDKEGDWMMKKNSSKEARSYAGGGKVKVGDFLKKKGSNIKVEVKDVKKDFRSGKDTITIFNDVTNYTTTLVDWSDYEKSDKKMATGGKTETPTKKGKGNHKMKATTDLARKIRKDGEKWTDAIKRASLQLK